MSLQLQPYCWGFGCNICLLWPDIIDFTFLVQTITNFYCILNIFDRGLAFGKFFLNILKNNFSMLVLTFKQKRMVVPYNFAFSLAFCFSVIDILITIFSIWKRFSKTTVIQYFLVSFALSNTFLSQEISEICLFIDFGSSFKILGGWFDCLWI